MRTPYYQPWNPKFEFAMKHALLHRPSGSIISYIPKNACSAIKATLLCDTFGYETEEFEAIGTGAIHSATQYISASLDDVISAKKTYIMFRDPAERLVSVFLDKFLSGLREAIGYYLKLDGRSPKLKTTLTEPERKEVLASASDVTFASFVNSLEKRGFQLLDRHWMPQARFLLYREYTNVFLMNDIGSYIDAFEKDLGLTWVDSRKFMTHDRSRSRAEDMTGAELLTVDELAKIRAEENKIPTAESLLTPELRQKILEIYEVDYTLIHKMSGFDYRLTVEA